MFRVMRTTTVAAAVLAAALAGGAQTAAANIVGGTVDPTTLDTATLSPGSYCNTLTTVVGCADGALNTMVYSAFQAAPDTVVTGFGYYYFYGAPSEYASTNWSIWQDTGSDTKQLVASGSGAGAAVGTVLSTDPTLVEVGGLDVTLQSGGEYWIGIQNNLTAGSGDYTLYAVTSAENTADTYVTRDVAASGEGLTFGADRTAFYQHAFYIDSEVVQGRTGGPLQPEPVSAPELSTWAMMLTGFAGLTWAARRRLAVSAR